MSGLSIVGFHHNQHPVRKGNGAFLPLKFIADAETCSYLYVLFMERIFKTGEGNAPDLLSKREEGNIFSPDLTPLKRPFLVNEIDTVLVVQDICLYSLLQAGKQQMDVAQRFFSDDITAAAGLYYLGFGSNYINEQQERQILSNPEAYALCVAELQPVEEAAR